MSNRLNLIVTLAFLSSILCLSSIRSETPEQTAEILSSHGIGLTPDSLLAFLQYGWRGANPPKNLPAQPAEKSALFNASWKMLAFKQAGIEPQTSLRRRLTALALRYARSDLPPGPAAFMQQELERIDPSERGVERARRMDYYSYNAMVALGISGCPGPQVALAAHEVYERENRAVVRMTYAQTLALLGDTSVVDDMVAEAMLANTDGSVAAANALYILYGKAFNLKVVTALAPRREAAQEIQSWWTQMKETGSADVNRSDAIERLAYIPPATPPSLGTLHQLLRAGADSADVTDQRGSRTAWARLEAMGTSLADQLLPIVRDKREDLDIRSEAIRWYARTEGRKARGVLRKLRKDPNPEIKKLAITLLTDSQ